MKAKKENQPSKERSVKQRSFPFSTTTTVLLGGKQSHGNNPIVWGQGRKQGQHAGIVGRGVAIRRKSNRIIRSSGSFLSIALASFLRTRYLITQRLLGLCTKREHYGKKRRSCAEQRRLLPRSTRVSTRVQINISHLM